MESKSWPKFRYRQSVKSVSGSCKTIGPLSFTESRTGIIFFDQKIEQTFALLNFSSENWISPCNFQKPEPNKFHIVVD